MADTLKPEQRKRVAEAVCPDTEWYIYDGRVVCSAVHGKLPFDPGGRGVREWKALVTWLAKHSTTDGIWGNAGDAITDDDTDALEALAYEILEAQDD